VSRCFREVGPNAEVIRLRHLEEVDILRHLSRQPCPHVIGFVDAWEQNRQLFIQTELCLGSLAFFLEEYGRVVERLDEGRVWKIVRELSDVSATSVPSYTWLMLW